MSDSEEGVIDESSPAIPVMEPEMPETAMAEAEPTKVEEARAPPGEPFPSEEVAETKPDAATETATEESKSYYDVEMEEAEPTKEKEEGPTEEEAAEKSEAAALDAETQNEIPGIHTGTENDEMNKPKEEQAAKLHRAFENRSDHGEQAAEESATSKELPYSTRGRSTDRDASSGEEKLSAVEGLEELGRTKDSSPATLGVSFLESLSEEERRTRTRFLPDVEGMHVLRKHEIKDDLSLARSLVSSTGITSLKKSKAKRNDSMDVDEEDGTSPSEDGSTDCARPGTKLLELPTRDLVVPSNAFVAPPATTDDDEGQTTSIPSLKTENGVKSPLMVDSVSTFDPPRPPESVGAKKKHRMLRWERRPEDVEVDLNNYRKTVQRTRQELQKAEAEFVRLETIDAHLRWNFLNHLNLINEEYTRLNEECGSVQQECVKAADLLTSRTRSRGAGKGSYIMRDVISVLKAKGAENAESVETAEYPIIENPLAYSGIGGLAPSVFGDWDRKTKIAQKEPASGWTVPGEKVKTPYGEGIVLEVFPPEEVPGKLSTPKEAEDEEELPNDKNVRKGAKGRKKNKKGKKKEDEPVPKEYLCNYFLPRVSIKLSFGVGYFSMDAIEPTENPCLFSDAKLASRWKSMVDTALSVGGTIDLEGMDLNSKEGQHDTDGGVGDKMDVDGSNGQNVGPSADDGVGKKSDDNEEEHVMPFGASLLPTASGRGNLLQTISVTEIEKAMDHALYKGTGSLGAKSNQGVTEELREWEDEEQEFLTLQASVLQLRNALVRQKRIRLLNERTNAATADRYSRSAELVAEMRSDLKSLKHRLEEEVRELGIGDTMTEQILSKFYSGQDSPVDVGEASPLKRSRRSIAQMEDAGNVPSYHGDDRESGDDHDHDLSGDDMEARPVKKMRPEQ